MALVTRVCFITGATRGIGKGIAEVFAQEGAIVIAHGRDKAAIDEVVKSLATPNKQEHFAVSGDIAVEEDRNKMIESIKSKFTFVDVVIHNAAVLGVIDTLDKLPLSDVRNTLNINVEAPLALHQKLMPLLKKGHNGSVLLLSSAVGKKMKGLPTWGGYAISKFAVEGLACVMSQELEQFNIRVNSIDPGRTRTDMRAAAAPSEDPMSIPAPADIAPLFVYLSRSDTPFITGQTIKAQEFINKKQNEIQVHPVALP